MSVPGMGSPQASIGRASHCLAALSLSQAAAAPPGPKACQTIEQVTRGCSDNRGVN